MHCTLNPNPGFRSFLMDPMQYPQRDIHALNNVPMQVYNTAAAAAQHNHHDYWNYHSTTMRPDFSLGPMPESPPMTTTTNSICNMYDYNNHNQYQNRDSAEKDLMGTIDAYYALSNESNGSGSSSSPPAPEVNNYYMSPTTGMGNNSAMSLSSMDSRSNSGSSSNMDNYHRPMYDHTKTGMNSCGGGNSLDLLTKQVNQYEPIQIVPISALLDDADFDFLLEPELSNIYRRGSTCSASTTTSSSLNFSRRSSSVDHFDSLRQRTSPPSPSISPPNLLIDATNYASSSTTYISRMQTPEFRHPEMDSEFGRSRSPEQDHTSRRHSFGATATIAELAKLKIASINAVPDTIGENIEQVGNHYVEPEPAAHADQNFYSTLAPSDGHGDATTVAAAFDASLALHHYSQKRHSIPDLPVLPPFSHFTQAHNIVDKDQQPQFTRRRESVSSLSDENHCHSHDELGVSSPECGDVNNQRRDSDASVKIIENDPGSFLFLGPCGKKRRIIRERKMSEPSEDHDEPLNSETRRCSLGDTRSNVPLHIVKQEPTESSDEATDSVRPLNLCIIEETRAALEKVRNLSLSSNDSLIPPMHYFEERRKSTSSIESLPPLLSGGLRGLAISSQHGLEGSVLYRQDRRFSEPIVSSRLEKPEKKKLKCPDCPKEFSQLRNFRYHRSKHEGTETFACTCPVCGKHFNDKGYLSSHLKIHRNAKEYHCEWCPKSFNQRVAYNMHIRIHTGLKPHQCSLCPKSFSRKMLLRQHLRTHTGERPYQCDVCNKCFADRSNMLLHKRLHSGERPYKCQECSKTFSKNHHLKTHMNHHAGIKPYQCEKCKACFSQSSNMKTHFRKCTGVAAPGAVTTMTPTQSTSPNAPSMNSPKASPGRPPKQGSPRSPKGQQQQSGPSPIDHLSVIAHSGVASDFYGNEINRRRSNPCLGQRNFFESHRQGQQLQQSPVRQLEEPGQFRKHSASFSGPSSSYGRHPQMYPMGQDPRFLTARNAIDLNSAIQFSMARVQQGLQLRPGMPGSPIGVNRSPPHAQRVSPPTGNQYAHHQLNPPPPSPTGEILRNSLLSKTPTQYQTGKGHSSASKDA